MDDRLPERVLIVRLGAIGDVTNALVVATAIKAYRPGVRVGWAVHDLALPLVDGHPSVDRAHPWRRGGGVTGLRAFLAEVRAERYQLVIDLQRILKSSLVARLSRAPRILGFDRGRSKELSWLWTRERIPPQNPGRHMVRQYMEFVRYLGIAAQPVLRLSKNPEAEAWADSLVAELGSAPVVISVGASKPENRWPPERFGRLARACAQEFDVPVVLTGGPDDVATAEQVAAQLSGLERTRNLAGRTDLLQLIALERRARLFVGCDTGPMHIAAAVQTPVVTLFGPANPERTGPWGSGHRVVRAPGVSGRMEEIPVDLVLGPIRERLRAQPAGGGPTGNGGLPGA